MNGDRQEMNRPDPREQEQRWLRFAARVRQGESIPFSDQWAEFSEIYSDRAAGDGPPPAWMPAADQAARSNLGQLMAAQGLAGEVAGGVAVASTPDQWTNTLIEVLTNNERAREMGQRGREIWEKSYSFDRIAEGIRAAVEEAKLNMR